MECTVGTRSLRHVFTPGFTFQIDTEEGGQVTRHTFQADYPSVKDAVSTLKSALQVGGRHCAPKSAVFASDPRHVSRRSTATTTERWHVLPRPAARGWRLYGEGGTCFRGRRHGGGDCTWVIVLGSHGHRRL
jgi:hypothetical protein